ncbi:MAG: hypothetical protein M3457_03640, partial [Chloroflexota bacterium]|nr:hypothetical protein [Chloroflexota bacterium]
MEPTLPQCSLIPWEATGFHATPVLYRRLRFERLDDFAQRVLTDEVVPLQNHDAVKVIGHHDAVVEGHVRDARGKVAPHVLDKRTSFVDVDTAFLHMTKPVLHPIDADRDEVRSRFRIVEP